MGTYSGTSIPGYIITPTTKKPEYKVFLDTGEMDVALLDSESFESDFGNWSNVTGDQLDWTRISTNTPSSGTGPSSASDGTWYVYLETSTGSTGHQAWLEYDFTTNKTGYVSFDYHMYGTAMGTLRLEGWDGSVWTTIWSESGDKGNSWFSATTPSTNFSNYSKLRFAGVRGTSWSSDMALDNINIYTSTSTDISSDLISGSVNISSSDMMPLANIVLNNTSGKYNDILTVGTDIKLTYKYENEGILSYIKGANITLTSYSSTGSWSGLANTLDYNFSTYGFNNTSIGLGYSDSRVQVNFNISPNDKFNLLLTAVDGNGTHEIPISSNYVNTNGVLSIRITSRNDEVITSGGGSLFAYLYSSIWEVYNPVTDAWVTLAHNTKGDDATGKHIYGFTLNTYEEEYKPLNVIEYDLEHYYDFNDDSSASVLVDLEENSNGVITGAVYTDEESISGNSLYFDGSNDYVTLDSPNISKDDSFSINFNAKPTNEGYLFYAIQSGVLRLKGPSDSTEASFANATNLLGVSSEEHILVADGSTLRRLLINSSKVITEVYNVPSVFESFSNIFPFGIFTSNNQYFYMPFWVDLATTDLGLIKIRVIDGAIIWEKSLGTYSNSSGIALDSAGNVYVSVNTSTGPAYHVKKVDEDGTVLWTFTGASDNCRAIAFNSLDNCYVTSEDGHIYYLNSETGSIISSYEFSPGVTGAGISGAWGVAVDSDDNIIVSYLKDTGSGIYETVAKYSPSYELIKDAFSDVIVTGVSPVQNISIDAIGNIYFYVNSRYHLFTKNLDLLLMSFQSHSQVAASTEFPVSSSLMALFKRGTFYPLIGLENNNNIHFKIDATTIIEYELYTNLSDFINIGVSYNAGWYTFFVNGKVVSKEYSEISEGTLTMKLGESQDTYGFFDGYIDNFAFWNRAVTEEEHFSIWNNNRNLERAEYAALNTPTFYGKIEALDYQYDSSSGFSVSLDCKSFPQLVDTTFTEVFINETAYQTIDSILETYREYENVVFSYWEDNGWHTTRFENGLSIWNTTPVTFPSKVEQLVVRSFENERGWKAIKDICEIAGLDVWVEYDDTNETWCIRTVRWGDFSLYPKELAHWRMNDEVNNINPTTSVVFELDNTYINKSSTNFMFSFNLSELPQAVKDELVDYDTFIFNGGMSPSKTNTTSTFQVIDTIETQSIAWNSFIDATGNLYIASGNGIRRYNFDRQNTTGVNVSDLETLNINPSFFSVTATLDGRYIYGGLQSGTFALKKFDSQGTELFSITPHSDLIRKIVVDKNNFVYTASDDNTIKKFDDLGSLLWTFSGFSSSVYGLDVDDSGYVYAVDFSGVIKRITSAGVEDWSVSTYTANDGYSLKLDSSNNVFVGFSSGRTVKLSSTGTQLFNINALGSSSITMDIDVDASDNIYLMKWNNYVYKCSNTGTVLSSNQYSVSTTDGWSIAVDKRTERDFAIYNIEDSSEEYEKEVVSLTTSPVSGEVYVRLNNLDSINENRFVFEVKDWGIKNLKSRDVWALDYNAVWHLESFPQYEYDEFVDSSQYYNVLVDNTTYYSSGYFGDSTQYSHNTTILTTVKTYEYGIDYHIKRIGRIVFDSSNAHDSSTVRVVYRFFYSDGTNSSVQYDSPSVGNTSWRYNELNHAFPEREVVKIEVRLRSSATNASRIRNQHFYDPIERPTDSLLLDVSFELNSVTGRQSIIGAKEPSLRDTFNYVDEDSSFELYVNDTSLLLDIYQTSSVIVNATANNTETNLYGIGVFTVMKTFDNISCYIQDHQLEIRTDSSGNAVEARAKYYYADDTIGYSNVISRTLTSYGTLTVNNPNPQKKVIKIEVEGRRVVTALYRIWHRNAGFPKIYRWGKHTFNLGTVSATTPYNVIVNYDGSTVYSFINNQLSSVHSHYDLIHKGNGYALGANGPSDTTDIIDGEVTKATIGRGLEPFLLETLLASRTVSDFYSFTYGDRLVDSVNNYNGTLDTNLATPIKGRIGNGLRTNASASDYKIYAYVDNSAFSGDFNISGWVRFPELSATEVSIVEKDNWKLLKTSTNKFKFVLPTSPYTTEIESDTILANRWYFVSAEYRPNYVSNPFISLRVSGNMFYQYLSAYIGASASELIVFGKNGVVDVDDFRIISGALTDEEYNSLYANGFGSESFIKDTTNDVIQSINLTSLSSSEIDSSNIHNRIIVYGNTIGDNIISVAYDEDSSSITNLWPKDKVINLDSLSDDDSLRQYARKELRLNKDSTLNSIVSSFGLPFIKPTYNVTINIPNANLSGVYRVQDVNHDLSDEFITSVTLNKRVDTFRDIFANKITTDDFITPTKNLNSMKYSHRITFEETPQIVDLVRTEIIDGDVRLVSTATSGTVTTKFINTKNNVTQCEFRRFENEFTSDDVYEVSNNGGATWGTIQRDRGLVHQFNSVGNRVGFRITMNRDATTDPTPSYRAVVLLYK